MESERAIIAKSFILSLFLLGSPFIISAQSNRQSANLPASGESPSATSILDTAHAKINNYVEAAGRTNNIKEARIKAWDDAVSNLMMLLKNPASIDLSVETLNARFQCMGASFHQKDRSPLRVVKITGPSDLLGPDEQNYIILQWWIDSRRSYVQLLAGKSDEIYLDHSVMNYGGRNFLILIGLVAPSPIDDKADEYRPLEASFKRQPSAPINNIISAGQSSPVAFVSTWRLSSVTGQWEAAPQLLSDCPTKIGKARISGEENYLIVDLSGRATGGDISLRPAFVGEGPFQIGFFVGAGKRSILNCRFVNGSYTFFEELIAGRSLP